MSVDADDATLPCPICSFTGVFNSVQGLRDRLISVSTNKISCPVCQEEVLGLDKLTIHLFCHVKLVPHQEQIDKSDISETKGKSKSDSIKPQKKKSKLSAAKNKPSSSPSTANTPMKYVKIYPKLPVISLNTVPVIDISPGQSIEKCIATHPIYISAIETEAAPKQLDFTCSVCGLQFININILKMHKCLIHNIDESSNQNVTRYQCHLCSKHFKMRGSLMVHLRVAHYGFSSNNSTSETNQDKCIEIKKSYQNSSDEVLNLDRNDNKQWQCDVCRKCFTTKYFLKKHKRLHTGETPYACTQCNKTFTFQQSYHKHLLYHNDDKPHVCNFCGRAFKELSTLHNHQRIHTGEKPFSCETCGKCFRQRVSYLVHRRIHTGVMPYKCTACDKSFRYKVSQRTHKCQVEPPGTVVRQTGDLIEKLKKKHVDTKVTATHSKSDFVFPEISEANAELVRIGAKLSLEDMESVNFNMITESETFNNDNENYRSSRSSETKGYSEMVAINDVELYKTNIDELIDYIPETDKNVPSPTEILKNLCISKDEDYICLL